VTLYLNLAMLVVSLALILVIIFQSRDAGLGGLGGGDMGGTGYHVRRGVERLLFNVTIGLALAFFVLALVSVVLIG